MLTKWLPRRRFPSGLLSFGRNLRRSRDEVATVFFSRGWYTGAMKGG